VGQKAAETNSFYDVPVHVCRTEVCRQVRELYPDQHLPIIMVSAATEEDTVVRSLDCGADDYITKPFKRVELLARIKAKLAAVLEQVRVACLTAKLLFGVACHCEYQDAVHLLVI
jgi:DNA-binding response OmpR family regulator